MIILIFVILMVLCFLAIKGVERIKEKHLFSGKKDTKFEKLVYDNEDFIVFTSGAIAVISVIVIIFMIFTIIINQATADGFKAKNEQRYNSLVYKAQTESIRDEFGIVNKEYIDEIQSWNEDVAKYQAYSNSFWIGIFYPHRAFDGFETINLKDIKMRE